MNIVMAQPVEGSSDPGDVPTFVEVQGTGEHGTFTRGQLDMLVDAAALGTRQLFILQARALAGASLIPPSERSAPERPAPAAPAARS